MKKTTSLVFSFFILFSQNIFAVNKAASEHKIIAEIIEASIVSYSGNCPCPFSRASNGNRCGKRSAYSRGGGYAPLCFSSDVTQEMIDKHTERKSSKGLRP